MEFKILSGGAAHGLFQAVAAEFLAAKGLSQNSSFGAVGGVRERLLDGEKADIVILTEAIMAELAASGIVQADSLRMIGTAATSIAVREASSAPDVGSAEALRAALLGAGGIYFPDPEQATAGIHFKGVLEKLEILGAVQSRLRIFPDGATAMRALAQSASRNAIGCTQATEIIATAGVKIAGDLPGEHALATVYVAGIASAALHAVAARSVIERLCGEANAAQRKYCGFA